MFRRISLSLLVLGTAIIPINAQAVVGTERLYLEWCTSTTDIDCMESLALVYNSKQVTYTQPGEIGGAPGQNVFYIFSPDGFVGADGDKRLRLEARLEAGNLFMTVGGTGLRLMDPLPARCVTNPAAPCTLIGDLPADLKISVSLRLSTARFQPGVAQANINEPVIATEKIANGNRFTFTGTPLRIMGYLQDEKRPMDYYVSQNAGDYVIRNWSISYLGADAYPEIKPCLNKGSMLVVSNAEMSNAPVWNRRDASIDMRTASSHYEPDGKTVFKGQYYARMSDGIVECLWNIKPELAAGKATVSIVYDNGVSDLATIAVTRKNGWLYLNASNFTYSSPTIKVKIGNAQIKATSQKTITCVKGKTLKKVSGTNPKCPTGFKLK